MIIAVIIVVGAVTSIINYVIVKQRINQRYKNAFAGQMALSIDHRASVSQLTPSELEEEFKRIDNGLECSNVYM